MKKLLALLFGICLSTALSAQPTFYISNTEGMPGDTVCIDIKASNFLDIYAFQFTLEWDYDTAQYIGLVDGALLINNTILNTTLTSEGRLGFQWNTITSSDPLEATGVFLENDETIFQLCLKLNACEGTTIQFTESIFEIEAYSIPTGLENIEPVTISGNLENNPIEITNIISVPESCPGNSDGYFNFDVNGVPFYDWPPDPPGGVITGNYTQTVTDENGCIEQLSIDVLLGLVIEHTPPSTICEGVDFQLEVNAPNATALFWQSDNLVLSCTGCPNPIIIAPTESDTVRLTVFGPNNCEESVEIPITVQSGNTYPFSDIMINSPVCEGESVLFEAIAFPNLTYFWTTPDGTEWEGRTLLIEAVTFLDQGDYTLRVEDELGCTYEDYYFLGISSGPNPSFTSIPESCPGACDGAILTTIENETDYEFVWSNAISSPSTSELCEGSYGLTITTAEGCSSSYEFNVESSLIQAIGPQDTTMCMEDTIQLFVNAPLATSYNWAPSEFLSCSDCPNPLLEGPYEDGIYSVTVTNGTCTSESSVFVTVRSYLDFNLLPFSNSPICEGEDLELYPNLFSPQAIEWSGPNGFFSEQDFPIIPNTQIEQSGPYLMEAIDNLGCGVSASFDVIVSNALDVSSNITNPVACETACSGSVEIFILNGLAPYTITIDSTISQTEVINSNTITFENLCPGDYLITIEDANGCSDIESFNLPASPIITFEPQITAVDCDGSVALLDIPELIGGTGDPYTVCINGVPIGTLPIFEIIPFPVDNSVISIKDVNGCEWEQDIIIEQVSPIVLDAVVTENATCGQEDGSIEISVSGGVPPYLYSWDFDPGISDGFAGNLAPGTYSVTVEDNNACQTITEVIVYEEPISGISPNAVICAGEAAELLVTTETSSTITWFPAESLTDPTIANPSAAPLQTTTYTATVEDQNGCSSTAQTTVFVIPENCEMTIIDTIEVNQAVEWCSILGEVYNPDDFYYLGNNCNIGPTVGINYYSDLCIEYFGLNVGYQETCVNICRLADDVCFKTNLFITVIPEDSVWPGDTDTNNIVNNFDLLNIGLGLDSMGFVRSEASLGWFAQPANNWPQSTIEDGVNFKHIDTDGSGLIDVDDTLAISLNWGLEHNFQPNENDFEARLENAVPFYVEPDTLVEGTDYELPLILGTEEIPAQNVYGLAFSILFDPELIKPGAMLAIDQSWLGDLGEDLIFMQREFHNLGRLDIGITRLDGINVNGWGEIAQLIVSLEDDILRGPPSDFNLLMETYFEIIDIKIISFQEEPLLVDNTPLEIEVISSTNMLELSQFIEVFPNPASSSISISSAQLDLQDLEVYDINGSILFSQKLQARQEKITLPKVSNGLYILKIKTKEGLAVKKITILSKS